MQFINDENNQATIKVVGIGGCGGNIINQLQIKKVFGVHCAAINTDSTGLIVFDRRCGVCADRPRDYAGFGGRGESRLGRRRRRKRI